MNIILVTSPERPDFFTYLLQNPNHKYFILWYEKPSQVCSSANNLPYNTELIYWLNVSTPKQLVDRFKPDKVVFFEIIDLRQIALIIYSATVNINTFFVDHGITNRESTVQRFSETTFREHKIPYLTKRFRKSFLEILKAKLFYYSVNHGFSSTKSYVKFLFLPFRMLLASPVEVLSKSIFKERIPKYSLLFNKANFERYNLYTGAEKTKIIFTGIPYFDSYFNVDMHQEDYIIYIDHPYFECSVNDWTSDYHRQIANTLFEFAEKHKKKIYIKLHPLSDLSLWNSYTFNETYISILQAGDFTVLYLKSQLVLGFSSSLLTGFLCAQKNVVLLGWHPRPAILGPDFSKTGLCHVSFDPGDLDCKFDYWANNNLTLNNPGKYDIFLKEFNYPFDGKASERIINAITGA